MTAVIRKLIICSRCSKINSKFSVLLIFIKVILSMLIICSTCRKINTVFYFFNFCKSTIGYDALRANSHLSDKIDDHDTHDQKYFYIMYNINTYRQNLCRIYFLFQLSFLVRKNIYCCVFTQCTFISKF